MEDLGFSLLYFFVSGFIIMRLQDLGSVFGGVQV